MKKKNQSGTSQGLNDIITPEHRFHLRYLPAMILINLKNFHSFHWTNDLLPKRFFFLLFVIRKGAKCSPGMAINLLVVILRNKYRISCNKREKISRKGRTKSEINELLPRNKLAIDFHSSIGSWENLLSAFLIYDLYLIYEYVGYVFLDCNSGIMKNEKTSQLLCQRLRSNSQVKSNDNQMNWQEFHL